MLHYLVFIVRRLFLFLLDCSFTVINPVTPCYSVSSYFCFCFIVHDSSSFRLVLANQNKWIIFVWCTICLKPNPEIRLGLTLKVQKGRAWSVYLVRTLWLFEGCSISFYFKVVEATILWFPPPVFSHSLTLLQLSVMMLSPALCQPLHKPYHFLCTVWERGSSKDKNETESTRSS